MFKIYETFKVLGVIHLLRMQNCPVTCTCAYQVVRNVNFSENFAHVTGLNIIFLSPKRLSGRNDKTSDKVNFRPNMRQNIFLAKRSGHQEFVFIWVCDKCQTYISTCPSASNRTSIVFKERLIAFTLTFCAYASNLNLK